MQLTDTIKKVPLFKSLSSSQFSDIEQASKVIEFSQDEIIIQEGALADALYIILKGSVQVFTLDSKNQNIILARLDEGQFFGEQAYLNNLIRNASVKALTSVKLIRINYDTLDNIFQHSNKFRKYIENISLENLLLNLTNELDSIDSTVKDLFLQKGFFTSKHDTITKSFKPDEVIFSVGDAGDYVYFITQGSVALLFDNDDNKIIINKNQLFGEMAILQNKPRLATAKAITPTTVVAVTAKHFLEAINQSTKFESLIASYKNIYTLPHNKAIVNQYIGDFNGSKAIFSNFKLPSGKVAICAKVIDQSIFTINLEEQPYDQTLKFKKGNYIERTIRLKDKKIVGLTVSGDWSEASQLCQILLEEISLDSVNFISFESTGNLLSISSNSSYHQTDVICNCMVVSYQVLKEKIEKGFTQFEELSNETGACTACGSCKPKLMEILGQSEWISATIHQNQTFSKDVQSYIIKPLYIPFKPFQPGQHVIIRIQVDNLFIERSYTLTSSNNNPENYEIMIKHYLQGLLSHWLFEHANKALLVWISMPSGKFVLKKSNKPLLCFAGGIGITPFIAFLRSNQNTSLNIIHSIHDDQDKIIPIDLENKINKNTNLQLWNSSSKGRLTEKNIEDKIKEIDPEFIYICGPDAFENMIVNHLKNIQFHPNNIFTEKFVSAN